MYANSSEFGALSRGGTGSPLPAIPLAASLQTLARTLAVSRASLWQAGDGGGLVCRALWDARCDERCDERRGGLLGGLIDGHLSDAAAGPYLAAMPQDRPVAAVDAPIDPVIGLLEEAYLEPFAVLSALHLRRGDRVIWLDQCRSMRLWKAADAAELCGAADTLFSQLSSRSL